MSARDVVIFALGYVACLVSLGVAVWIGQRFRAMRVFEDAIIDGERLRREMAPDIWREWT